MKRDPIPFHAHQQSLDLCQSIIVDLFAGGGGVSSGIEMALGVPPHIAINHNDNALSMHRANHPFTEHLQADVREVSPRAATRGRHVGALHLSPDCTHHSQAVGGQPRDAKIRALSWVGIHWAGTVHPDVITLENVKQIRQWGPLVAKRDPATGRVVKLDGTVAAPGEHVPVAQQYLVPDKRRAGKTWRRFKAMLRAMGYEVEERVLNAADYGMQTRTSRERLIMIARCDGLPIVWPEPENAREPKKGQHRWRGAHEAIDFSLPSRSIFDRPRPLAEATMRRIAKGVVKFVLQSGDPFIVPIAHYNGSEPAHDIREPLRTITAHPKGGSFALGTPVLVQTGYGERDGQAPRVLDLEQPLGTVVAGGVKHALATAMLTKFRGASVGSDIQDPMPTITSGGGAQRPAGAAHAMGVVTAYMMQANGGFNDERGTPGHDLNRPMSSIASKGSQQQLVTAHLAHLRSNCDARDIAEPVRTLSAGGEHHALVVCELSQEHQDSALRVAAFLMRYYGEGGQWGDLRDPMATITTKDRLALVTVLIKGTPYVIVDIQLRMLTPPELYRATGFPADYIIDHGHDGRRFSKSEQVRMVGNAVPPEMIAAVYRANCAHLAIRRIAA